MHGLILLLGFGLCLALPAASYSQQAPNAALAVAGDMAQEPAGALTLDRALALAGARNPELAVFRGEVAAVSATIAQARTRPNPVFGAQVEDTQQDTRTTTVQLSQPIELGGKREARIAASERSRDAARAELAIKRAEVRAAVIASFHEVLVAQERARLAAASLQLAGRAADVVSRRVTAGRVSPVEETRARVAEAAARVEQRQAASELAQARRRLGALWGSTSPRFTEVSQAAEALPATPPLPALMKRLADAPQLVRARHEIERRRALAGVEHSRAVPDVTVSVGAVRDEQLGRNQALFGVSVPIPLFDRNQGNLLEALRRVDKATDELGATEVRLAAELAQAHERAAAAATEVETLDKEILPGAQSAYDAHTRGYELGRFGFLDVLDAQRTLFQARIQYLRALGDWHAAAADIERILGPAGQQE